jgi:hypothetical protein
MTSSARTAASGGCCEPLDLPVCVLSSRLQADPRLYGCAVPRPSWLRHSSGYQPDQKGMRIRGEGYKKAGSFGTYKALHLARKDRNTK